MHQFIGFLLLACCFQSSVGDRDSGPDSKLIAFWMGEVLREDPRVRSTDIRVSCFDGTVTIAGVVQTLSERNYAGLIARRIRGVEQVVNELSVRPSSRADETIRKDLKGRLNRMSFLPANRIKVSVLNGVGTLDGTVDSMQHRREVEMTASEVFGVRLIRNQIDVSEDEVSTDAEIKAVLQDWFRTDVSLSSVKIDTSVVRGIVTLNANAGSSYLRRRAESIAWQARGVKDVVNQIQVVLVPQRNDFSLRNVPDDVQLAGQVVERLNRDARVDSDNTRVESIDGRVTLSGSVSTQYARDLSPNVAREVRGVLSVENLLQVQTRARPDSDIQADVVYLLTTDATLVGRDISAKSDGGIVELTGNVNSFALKIHAENVAGRARGVRRLRNRIEVTSTSGLAQFDCELVLVGALCCASIFLIRELLSEFAISFRFQFSDWDKLH